MVFSEFSEFSEKETIICDPLYQLESETKIEIFSANEYTVTMFCVDVTMISIALPISR